MSEQHAQPVAWQFRFVYADGRRGAWSNPLEMPRNMRNGSSAAMDGVTFEVRDLFAGPVGGGSEGAPAEGVVSLAPSTVAFRASPQQIAKWALEAIEAGPNAAVLMNLEGVKDHLRSLAASPSEGSAGDAPKCESERDCKWHPWCKDRCRADESRPATDTEDQWLHNAAKASAKLVAPGAKVYCCYGMYAEVGHSSDCKHASSVAADPPASPAGTAVPGMKQEKN